MRSVHTLFILTQIILAFGIESLKTKIDLLSNFLPPVNDLFPEPGIPGTVFISENSGLFFWLFRSRHSDRQNPLVISLAGGPGGSSLVTLFNEYGPLSLQDGRAVLSENSWNEHANLVFVDHPIGTGFSPGSFAEAPKSEKEVANQFFIFLQGFYDRFPEFRGRELYLVGESYAGHFIPFISTAILRSTECASAGIRLAGAAIGDGWVDPANQVLSYAPFALQNGLIGQTAHKVLQPGFRLCSFLLQKGLRYLSYSLCNFLMQSIPGNPFSPRFNMFNIKKSCAKPPLCYDISDVSAFLNRSEVQTALGVSGITWKTFSFKVYIAMLLDWGVSASQHVAQMLATGVKVLIYYGDKDYLCNWLGGAQWVSNMDWPHREEFNALNFKNIGFAKSKRLGNFEFLLVPNAGHSVPTDQPKAGKLLFARLLSKWTNK